MGSTVRSGLNLPIASASESLSAAVPFLSVWATERASAPGRACSTASALVLVEHRDDGGRARLERLADLVVEAGLHLVLGEAPDDPAGGRADHGRRQQRRRREAHEEAHRAAVAQALAAQVVAGLLDDDLAVQVMGDEDGALDLDGLRLDLGDERLEVLRRGVDIGVSGDQDVGRSALPSGSSPSTVFPPVSSRRGGAAVSARRPCEVFRIPGYHRGMA